jgi:hypothetical protein
VSECHGRLPNIESRSSNVVLGAVHAELDPPRTRSRSARGRALIGGGAPRQAAKRRVLQTVRCPACRSPLASIEGGKTCPCRMARCCLRAKRRPTDPRLAASRRLSSNLVRRVLLKHRSTIQHPPPQSSCATVQRAEAAALLVLLFLACPPERDLS